MSSSTPTTEPDGEPRLAYSVSEVARATTLSDQSVYREIDAGRLRARKIRGRVVIPAEALDAWLADPGPGGDAA